MNRRLVAAVVAVLLAAAGAGVLLSYVGGADARAQAAERLSPVLVVTADVPLGTPADDLASSVSVTQVPARLVTDGALTDLSAVSGLVTTAALLPGEMLLSGRFGAPDATRADGSLPAPDGTEEVSVTLERQRAAGGTPVPGDLVGLLGTYATINDGPDVSFELDGVLVTRVAAPADPDGVYTLTLAVTPDVAGHVAAAQSGATVWLTLQAPGTPSSYRTSDGTSVQSDDSSDDGSDDGSTASTGATTGSASTSGDDS